MLQAAAFLNLRKQQAYNPRVVELRRTALRALAALGSDASILRAEALVRVSGRSGTLRTAAAPLISDMVAILRSLWELAPVLRSIPQCASPHKNARYSSPVFFKIIHCLRNSRQYDM